MIHIARNRTESSSVSRDFASHYGGDTLDSRKVPTIALNDLLARAKIGRVDFLSMDIELSEPQALAGFDLSRYRPALVCVEATRPSGSG